MVPMGLPGVDTDILFPRQTWENKERYDYKSVELAKMFRHNFKKYEKPRMTNYSLFGPNTNY